MKEIELSPPAVFSYFEEICQIPRQSKHEKQIIAYLIQFANSHQLVYKIDEVGNVLISKKATAGKEHAKCVILQSHVDMVCEKNNDVTHNFFTDPIQTYIDGEWLKAKGTTLGADNGIGVATQLAILADNTLSHGPLECLFTIDEETGLTGAFALKEGFVSGDILINLDSEDEGELFIGCAGGVNTVATFEVKTIPTPDNYFYFTITVKGLKGGHSGDDINKNRGNAIKILNRFLHQIERKYDLYLCQIQGGNLRNAIAREASALCAIPFSQKEEVRIDFNIFAAEVESELHVSEPTMRLVLASDSIQHQALDKTLTSQLIKTLYALPHGILSMSQEIEGLVESSTNLASIKQKEEQLVIETSQRSSILSARTDVANRVQTVFELGGATVTRSGGYPGWKPNPTSPILQIAIEAYTHLFGVSPKVKAIHAGLECGLFLDKYPSLDMVSFGPTLRDVHSPDERMHIPSVTKFWSHLVEVLERIN